ncbi:hypothetical protein CCHR01_14914 [Colletotrichum chrysophilum]|uniref:Uncharacterized protein n=1 Tax=Colletotrichum chrysophilum TaxID=1836956 RepID=A0AAD9EBV5_9PEZI|nr:hypothetical protein CCHR01_14914 [Colletotrichum chrysophilum]
MALTCSDMHVAHFVESFLLNKALEEGATIADAATAAAQSWPCWGNERLAL